MPISSASQRPALLAPEAGGTLAALGSLPAASQTHVYVNQGGFDMERERGSMGHESAIPRSSQMKWLKMSSAQVVPWAGSLDSCGLRQGLLTEGHGQHLPGRASGPAASCARREPQPVLAVCAHSLTRPPVPGCVGDCDLWLPHAPQFLLETQVRGGGPARMRQVGVSLHTLLGTHLANARRAEPSVTSLERLAQGAWLLAGSTCTWDCGWASAWLPPSATSLPITELGRFPPNRTLGHCAKGARGAKGAPDPRLWARSEMLRVWTSTCKF